MLCRNCGFQLEEGDVFCPNCGTKEEVNEYTKANLPQYGQREFYHKIGEKAPICR